MNKSFLIESRKWMVTKLSGFKWKLMSLLILPSFSFAEGYGDDGFVLVNLLHKVIDLITSKIGGAVFAIAIVAVGYAWLGKGVMDKGKAIATIAGISLVFGASWLVQYFGFQV